MRWVVLGADGMLGRAWVRQLADADVVDARYPDVDITRPETYEPLIERGNIVVNCAAFTDVDGAEDHEDQAAKVNGDAVGALSRYCASRDVFRLIHYSTDYVFSGDATEPYPVDAPIAPVNAYGRTKALGERALVEGGANHLLIRTSWVYAPWGKNFVLTIARAAAERDTLRVVDDQRGRPTSARHLAATTLRLLDRDFAGTFHVTDGGECTWFDLATHVAARVNPSCRVEPCTSDEFPRKAVRPSYSVLDLSQTEDSIGPLTSWQDNVDRVLETLD